MHISIKTWLAQYMEAAQAQFGNRIWFLGLQGSYGRGEATPESDLDVVLILDTVSASDLQAYSAMLDRLPRAGAGMRVYIGQRRAPGLGTLGPVSVLPRHQPPPGDAG